MRGQFSALSTILGMSLRDQSIMLFRFDGQSWNHLTTVKPRPWSAFAFSPDDKMLATGTSEGVIQLWSIPDPGNKKVLQKDAK